MRSILTGAIDALAGANPWFVVAAIGLYGVGLLSAVVRWRMILSVMGYHVRFADALLVYLAGIFVNNVTPAMRLGGEACRVAAIGIRAGVPVTAATLSTVYDRLSEVLPVAGLVLCAIPALVSAGARFDNHVPSILMITLVVIGGGVAYWQLVHSRAWWKNLREKIAASPLNRRSIMAVVGYSGVVWVQDVLRLMIVAAALGVKLTVPQGATLAVLSILGGLVPTIGGLGAIEGGMVAGLMFFGVRADTAAAITAIERAISYVMATGAGASAFVVVGGRTVWRAVRSRS
jgi:uncharacterized membrane protein YbhN (UPF0104 family)